MLLKLTNDQITGYWDKIKESLVVNDLPIAQATEANFGMILAKLLRGDAQVWVLQNDKDVIYALIVTCFSFEGFTGTKSLLIYSLYGYSFVPEELWKKGLEQLQDFARANNCIRIIAFSKVPRVLEIVKMLGGDIDSHLLTLEV